MHVFEFTAIFYLVCAFYNKFMFNNGFINEQFIIFCAHNLIFIFAFKLSNVNLNCTFYNINFYFENLLVYFVSV